MMEKKMEKLNKKTQSCLIQIMKQNIIQKENGIDFNDIFLLFLRFSV